LIPAKYIPKIRKNKLEMNFKPNKHKLYLFIRVKEREIKKKKEKEYRYPSDNAVSHSVVSLYANF